MGRLSRSDTVEPRELAWITPVSVSRAMLGRLPPNRLGAGERAVIAYAHASGSLIAGLDDLQARRLAQSLDLQVVGTLGILLRAKAAALIPAVRPVLDAVVEQGFRLSYDMYQDVLLQADEG
jgi:predicted nucleic acid-binding protein